MFNSYLPVMYRVCGHCHRRLSEKALKEHERLYLEDGVWLTESKIERGVSSSDELSEPITLSDPPDPDEAPESVEMSSDEQLPAEDFDDDSREVVEQRSKLHPRNVMQCTCVYFNSNPPPFFQVKIWNTGWRMMMI